MMKDPPGSAKRIAAYIRHQSETTDFELLPDEDGRLVDTQRRFCWWKDPHGLRINYDDAPDSDIWGAITHWIERDQDWTYHPE